MTLKDATIRCFRNFTIFTGRATRAEFWKFVLFIVLASTILTIVNILIFGPTVSQEFNFQVGSDGEQSAYQTKTISYDSGWLGTVFGWIILLPWLAVSWRRLHDIGRSGLWTLLPIVPMAVAFPLMFLGTTDVPIEISEVFAADDLPDTIAVPNATAFGFAWVIWFIGGLGTTVLLIVWLASKSEPGPNKYGPNPTEVPQ
ncbi:MAG: DUF805 domain-containing protein [Pseudomonadota bacterium]